MEAGGKYICTTCGGSGRTGDRKCRTCNGEGLIYIALK